MNKIRILLGIAGINKNEHPLAHISGRVFNSLIFFIAICVPFLWYLETNQLIKHDLSIILHWMIWGTFTLELVMMICIVQRKIFYLFTNWLNLIIIIFAFPLFWFHMPMVSLMRILILLRVLISWWDKAREFLSHNHLNYTLLVFVAVVIIGGSVVSLFDSGIKNPWDGMWWAVQTITTVGYGDVVPSTAAGRIFAAIMMLMGVGLISILTANFSAYLLGKNEKQIHMLNILLDIQSRTARMEQRLEKLEGKLPKKTPLEKINN